MFLSGFFPFLYLSVRKKIIKKIPGKKFPIDQIFIVTKVV